MTARKDEQFLTLNNNTMEVTWKYLKNHHPAICERMLEAQFEQTGWKDVSVFERRLWASKGDGGFDWARSKEGVEFWNVVLSDNPDHFYTVYPRQELPAYVILIANQDEAGRVLKAAKAKGYLIRKDERGHRKGRWCDYSRKEDEYFHTHVGDRQLAGFFNHCYGRNDQPISLPDFEAFCYGQERTPLDDLPVLGEGVEAWVWDDDPNVALQITVIARYGVGFYLDGHYDLWKNASLTDPRQVTVTIQEIAEWKGVEVSQLTIKNEK